MSEPVRVERGAVSELVLNRPEVRNALNGETVARLTAAVRELSADPAVRAVIVRGAGDRSFSAGGDLNEILGADGLVARRTYFGGLADLFGAIAAAPQPYIAAVRGHALGGGCGLACACDLTLAADDARFGLPEVKIGLFPMVVLAPVLRAAHNKKRIYELCFLGELVGAAEAREIGLCGRIVPAASLLEEARRLAGLLASFSPTTLAIGKSALRDAEGLPPDRAQAFLREMTTLMSLTDDAVEGIGAFLAKRQPEWRGR